MSVTIVQLVIPQKKMNIDAVSIKLPAFWTAQPHIWFTQTEEQFQLRNIKTDETMYYNSLFSFDQETAQRIADLITNLPNEGKYNTLKHRLLHTFGLSKAERASLIFNISELGDRKPSELLDEMLSYIGDHHTCLLFEYIYLSHLPEDIRLSLSNFDSLDARSLGEKADSLWVMKYVNIQNHVNLLSNVRS